MHREHVERGHEGREDQEQARREAGDSPALRGEAAGCEEVAERERWHEPERLEIERPRVRIVHWRDATL